MEIDFFSKLRDAGSSLVMTVPSEVVEELKLKAGKAYKFKVIIENGGGSS